MKCWSLYSIGMPPPRYPSLPRGCHDAPAFAFPPRNTAGPRGTTQQARTSRNASTFDASPRRATVYVEAPRDGSNPAGVAFFRVSNPSRPPCVLRGRAMLSTIFVPTAYQRCQQLPTPFGSGESPECQGQNQPLSLAASCQ